jgi:hypothetical protein
VTANGVKAVLHVWRPSTAVAAVLVLLLTAGGGCTRGDDDSAVVWSTREAESIREVRGLPVRVLECRGLGAPRREGDSVRFARFACLAGARQPWERFDSVAVRFELRPRRDYDGSPASYELRNVRFTGGPGIP